MTRRRMRRFTDYDPFAWFYTNYWGQEFHRAVIPVLDRLLLPLLPRKASILDLCCGDGRILQTLARRGYRVTGIDGSECMLTYARQRAPKASLLLADARRFKLSASFDAVISTFDSLNHIMEPADLKKVFHNVFQCLRPAGYFVFDLNREEAYIDVWAHTATVVDKTAVAVARGSYDTIRKIAVCNMTVLRLVDNEWRRSDFRLTQRLHMRDDVLRAVEETGFSATVLDAAKDLGMSGEVGAGRDFYLARK